MSFKVVVFIPLLFLLASCRPHDGHPVLEDWVPFYDAYVGKAYYTDLPAGTRVITNHADHVEGTLLICAAGERWHLGRPGVLQMYEKPETYSMIDSLKNFVVGRIFQ